MTTAEFLAHLKQLDIRLSLNGDKLKLAAPPGVLTPDIKANLAERKAEILQLLQKAQDNRRGLISLASQTAELPLSYAQQRLWFLAQFEGASATYNITRKLKFTGDLDMMALERAIAMIIQRHEVLRTNYKLVGDNPVQTIQAEFNFNLPVVNLCSLSPTEQENEVKKLAIAHAGYCFDLENELPIRCQLLKLDEQKFVFLLSVHHIAFDGWSMRVFNRELSHLYQDFTQGRSPSLEPLAIQYFDFAVWQKQWLQANVLENQLAYWKEQLADAPALLQLPYDKPRSPEQSFEGAIEYATIPSPLVQQLKQLAQQSGSTLFMVLFAAYSCFMHRLSQQNDLCIGTPIANRNQQQIEDLIGFFVNTLVLRTQFSGEGQTFLELLQDVRQTALAAYTHQDIPFEQVVQEVVQSERALSYSPLVQVVFALQNMPERSLNIDGLDCVALPEDKEISKFDLALLMSEENGELFCRWEYSTDLFEPATIRRWIGHFQTLLEGIVASPEQSITKLPLLTESECHHLLFERNTQSSFNSSYTSVVEQFEAQVNKNPEAIALVFEDQQLTYQELNKRANQLAHYLLSKGIKPEALIGVCVERSPEMIVAILSILKVGAAYVPLEPNYPQERLAYMQQDTKISFLIIQQSLDNLIPKDAAIERFYIDQQSAILSEQSTDNPEVDITSESLAYVMYTSGSTGVPKGVEIVHRGITRLAQSNYYATFETNDTFLQFAPLAFDASTFEIWCCLLNGAKLVIMPPGAATLAALAEAINTHQVTTLWLTAGLFHLMVENHLADLAPVRQLLAGGDVLSIAHVQQVTKALPNCRVINGYGPTENTTFTCCYPVESEKTLKSSVPIGRPIAGTSVYLLDPHLQPVPVGVPGELYTGGEGLARGYRNQPELTQAKLIPNPFSQKEGDRLYKTGDLARYLPDGNIEFLGRIDNQVKIRGFRIELGEIEAALTQHPQIESTVVLLQEASSGDKRIIAYIIATNKTLNAAELRLFLNENLPDYMIPAAFVFLDVLPLTANGKVDRRALPVPDFTQRTKSNNFIAPGTNTEQKISQIWCSALNLNPEKVSIYDNFFELGGHSLIAVQVFSEIESHFKKSIPLSALFRNPTIKDFATFIEGNLPEEATSSSCIVPIQAKGEKTPIFGLHAIGTSVQFYRNLTVHLGDDQPFYGIQSRFLQESQSHAQISIESMAEFYLKEIKKIQPQGPYLLVGYSYGGSVAHEMACQLVAHGEQVALLGMFDVIAPGGHRRLSKREQLWAHCQNIWREGLLYIVKKISNQIKFRSIQTQNKIKTQYQQRAIETNTHEYFEQRLAKVKEVHLAARKSHKPQMYPGDVVLFRAKRRADNVGDRWEELLGWDRIAQGQIKVYDVEGGHSSIFDQENTEFLAQQFQQCLADIASSSNKI